MITMVKLNINYYWSNEILHNETYQTLFICYV